MGDNGIAAAQYRDLYFYSLYRVLEAGLGSRRDALRIGPATRCGK